MPTRGVTIRIEPKGSDEIIARIESSVEDRARIGLLEDVGVETLINEVDHRPDKLTGDWDVPDEVTRQGPDDPGLEGRVGLTGDRTHPLGAESPALEGRIGGGRWDRRARGRRPPRERPDAARPAHEVLGTAPVDPKVSDHPDQPLPEIDPVGVGIGLQLQVPHPHELKLRLKMPDDVVPIAPERLAHAVDRGPDVFKPLTTESLSDHISNDVPQQPLVHFLIPKK